MNETHANAMFADDERKWIREDEDDGNILFLRTPPPPCRTCFAEQLEALPDIPSADYQVKSICMDLLKPTQTHEEWRQMMRKIYEWRKHIVWMEGADECKTTNNRPQTTANLKSITDSAQCLNGKKPADVATVEI